MKRDTGKSTTTTGSPQREALARSEKQASAKQPGSYKDKETAEKLVGYSSSDQAKPSRATSALAAAGPQVPAM